MTQSTEQPTVEVQPAAVGASRRRLAIGLPASGGAAERRFPLTPEAAGALVEQGFEVRIEAGAAAAIHYGDEAYAGRGAVVVGRGEALRADMVVALAPLAEADVRRMRRGAMLLTLLRSVAAGGVAKELLRHNVVAIALDLVGDSAGHMPFADALSEVDGRGAVALAAAMLASPELGKGILLGGVAGVSPCEVLVLGAGIAGCAAAASAVGLGAAVRVLDDDVYRLRRVGELTHGAAQTATLHQRVLDHALPTADVVVCTPMRQAVAVGARQVELMKRGAIVLDLQAGDGEPMFPTLPQADSVGWMTAAAAGRVCYVGVGNAVARTAAMALSDALLVLLRDMAGCDGAVNTVRLLSGVQRAVVTFLGKPVNQRVAAAAGMRPIDISLLLGCG